MDDCPYIFLNQKSMEEGSSLNSEMGNNFSGAYESLLETIVSGQPLNELCENNLVMEL